MDLNKKIKLEILKFFNKNKKAEMSAYKIFESIEFSGKGTNFNEEAITFERTEDILENLVRAKKFYRKEKTDYMGDFVEMRYGLIEKINGDVQK